LRLVVMDAIERIEIALRALLALELSYKYKDPFAYAVKTTALPQLSFDAREKFLQSLARETENSRELFVRHFFEKYGDAHSQLPIWMATEILTFGELLTLFRGVDTEIQKRIARHFGVQDRVLGSWLLTLNTVRNICAHHGRLWNRELGTNPLIPSKELCWKTPVTIPNKRVFAVLTICRHCLSLIAPQSGWANRLKEVLAEFPSIPLRDMAFPGNWTASPIWQEGRITKS
jgi:abortive infection bacteriophage resistance protein